MNLYNVARKIAIFIVCCYYWYRLEARRSEGILVGVPVDDEETRRESRPPRVANANARGKEDEEDEEEKRIAKFLCKSANAQHEKRKRIA